MNADFIAPSDPRWGALVDRLPHDVYHLPEYALIAGRTELGQPAAFYAELDGAACLIPLLIRHLPEGIGARPEWRDATSPYGYPCPLTTNPDDAITLGRFLEEFRALGAARDLITAFIRLHPLLPLSMGALRALGRVEFRGPVVALDLTRSREELWSGFRKTTRNEVQQLRRSGFVASMDQWDLYPEFIRLYEETMRRVGASRFYFFPMAYYDSLRTELHGSAHLCTVTAPDGRVACAGLFFEEAGIVQYHLSGTELLPVAPSKLMVHFVLRWAKERGNRVLHLGGGLGGEEDSLFRFKAGFSEQRAEFQILQVVFDEERYRALTSQFDPGNSASSTFFPLYRSPKLRTAP